MLFASRTGYGDITFDELPTAYSSYAFNRSVNFHLFPATTGDVKRVLTVPPSCQAVG